MQVERFLEEAGNSLPCEARRQLLLAVPGKSTRSGVQQPVCGARDEDARAIGFDEGPKLTD